MITYKSLTIHQRITLKGLISGSIPARQLGFGEKAQDFFELLHMVWILGNFVEAGDLFMQKIFE